MRTIRTKVYKFDELVVDAQQNAIEAERANKEIELDWWNESAKEQIETVGFIDDVKLQYSLSYSQGDGLSFSCNSIENSVLRSFFAEILGENKEKTIETIMEYCSFSCTGNRGNHYCYASKSDIRYEFDDYYANHPQIHSIVAKVEEKIENLYITLCKDLEKEGYAEIDFQYTDECIISDFTNNEVEFTKDGKIFNS